MLEIAFHYHRKPVRRNPVCASLFVILLSTLSSGCACRIHTLAKLAHTNLATSSITVSPNSTSVNYSSQIAITATGALPLIVPAWPEAARAIEDCRS